MSRLDHTTFQLAANEESMSGMRRQDEIGGRLTMSVHSGSILFGHTVDALDVVACDIAPSGFHGPTDEEEHVERAGFTVQDRVLDGFVGEGQAAWAAFKAVDVPLVTGLGVAQLVKRHWLIFKAKVGLGQRSGEMVDVPDDVPRSAGVDVNIVLNDFVAFTIHLDRVPLESGLHKRLHGLERLFICPAQVRIRPTVPPVIGKGGEQPRPVPGKRGDGIEGEANKGAPGGVDHRKGAFGNAPEYSDNTAFGQVVDHQDNIAVASEPAILFRDCSKRGCEVCDFQRGGGLVANYEPIGIITHFGPSEVAGDRSMNGAGAESISAAMCSEAAA